MVTQEMDYLRKFGRVVLVLFIMRLTLGISFSFRNKDDTQSPAKVNWEQRIESQSGYR